jgi:hypothetical protein
MNDLHDTNTPVPSRRAFLRTVAFTAATAVPIVAGLVYARPAQAYNECDEVICYCTGCKGGCTVGCQRECDDAHDGGLCSLFCSPECTSCSPSC